MVTKCHKHIGGSLMRKLQEYIIKDNKIFIGLEDSKRTWKVCVRCEEMIVHETSMPSEYDNLLRYLTGNYPGCSIKLVYEAGFSGFWLHELLCKDGIDCIVTPPNKVVIEKSNMLKTDKRDARRLSKNLENNDCISCHVPYRERREDRQISRTLEQVQRDIVRTKNRIRRFLDYHGLNSGLRPGSWNDSDYQKLNDLPLSKQLKISISVYLHQLNSFQELRKSLHGELKRLYEKDRYKKSAETKKSCPGIGWLTAIRLTLEWGDMSRFKTGKQIAAFTGLTSREYSTGESIRRGSITAQSSEKVRSWLIQCAWHSIKKDSVLLEKFRAVWKNSGSKKKAIVAVARKLAVRMRAIELSNQHYCTSIIE